MTALYRERLPQLDGGLFVTDGGIETTLIFHRGLELPAFAAFHLLKDAEGTEELRRYYVPYADLAREREVGLVLESPTWRVPSERTATCASISSASIAIPSETCAR